MGTSLHATSFINQNMFICVAISLLLPSVNEGAPKMYDDGRNFPNDDGGRRLTREYHLRQGALRGLIVKPSRQYDLQYVEMFLGIPYAAPPTGNFRFMPPVSAPPWPGVRMATRFAPVCPQALPPIKKDNPPSLGRQHYLNRLKPFLANESEDCLYLNIYVPYREQKSKKFPVLVFIHGDSFEWSSGNPYDGRILASYGNIMVITVNFRLGILGFMKPSLTEHVYGNNGLLDQLAALQWIKDNIEDLNGDPNSVTLMGHGTGAACVNFLMLSPISNGLFHRAILMSGNALSDWAMTNDPTQYTLQVAQSLGCSPHSRNLMSCLQKKPLSEIKKVQILSREFETPLGPVVAGSFIPSEPASTMDAFPNLLSKYQLLSGVVELESYHDFGVIELDHGILENQRDDFIKKYAKIIYEGAEKEAMKIILKEYAPSKLNPQSWSVETNRDVILNLLSDARTLAPAIRFANYQSKANRQSYFYVFGHNSVSTDYAPLNKSVHGQEMPYVLGVPLGGANTHFHLEYTQQEKLLSEVMMRLWTNFVKIGSPNTQSVNKYFTKDPKLQSQYNVEWPEYDVAHQPYLRLDLPPSISSLYRSNYTGFWIDTLPKKMSSYVVDPLFDYTPTPTTQRPKPTVRSSDPMRRIWQPQIIESPSHYVPTNYGKIRSYYQPDTRSDPDTIYRQIQSIKTPSRPVPTGLMEKTAGTTTAKPKPIVPVKTSSATVTLVVSLGVLFLLVNIATCSILYFKRRKLRLRERVLNTRQPRAEIGEVDVIGQKSSKDDKSALQTLKNGCSVIKSMSFNKMRNGSKKIKKKSEQCKTPKSDDSGGFRERFQLRRHLSTSTLDAHTKVRDWIANEVMHRCSPGILRKSNSDLKNDKQMTVAKPFTRSEELLSDVKKPKKETLKVDDLTSKNLLSKSYSKGRTSEKTTSTSALGSHSSIGSHKQSKYISKQGSKSSESIKSKATESMKSKKVSVAIDATPSARTNSILQQEPIEISKSFDGGDHVHSSNQLQRSKTEGDFKLETKNDNENKIYTNMVTLSVGKDKPLTISHKHSVSDPVKDVDYEKLYREKMEGGPPVISILPPVTFRNEINVTSRDEGLQAQPLSPEDALLTIKKRNFPKVLPDLPKAQKRLSLQPATLQTFRSFESTDSQDRPKVPPQPPPRTSTLERRLAYANTKLLSSFNASKDKIPEVKSYKDYVNIDTLAPISDSFQTRNKSIDNSAKEEKPEPTVIIVSKDREYPKVIIASSDMQTTDPNIIIKPSTSNVEMPTNVPRVRLPDDFHSQAGSLTSFSSFYSDDDDEIEEDIFEDIAEDKLIKELVGGVESPTNMDDVLDSKGPETIFEKKLEIVPVKINPGYLVPKNHEDYICISDLHLPDSSGLERTAQIKPNFGLNKLQHRTESINRPPEKAVKVKQKRSVKPSSLLGKSRKSKSSERSSDSSKLEHSNSGSSNDTETSTGTVRKVEIKKDG
ncbi:uncharacterized protein LOC115455607 [Manduca sexta]|uniref:uncharacterized protein LOC115455607 n=1 Tax=Manduca sexta TaxID=7130 RepID=UPI00188FDA83|nr:uncharacterized protein LOC115455607 [Manduca sexta]